MSTLTTEATLTAPAPTAVATYSAAVVYGTLSSDTGANRFHFKCDIPGIEVGDLVVVKDRNGHSLVTVVQVYETPGPNAKAWVADKVDLSREETRKKRTELESKLRSAVKDQELLVQARNLAGNDPHIASLVAQLESM